MYYGLPSSKTLLEGFLSRKGLTYNDMRALFGFNPIEIIPYNFIQAVTALYNETHNKNNLYPYYYQFINQGSGQIIELQIKNEFNAIISIASNDRNFEIRYPYKTDNFPCYEIYDKDIGNIYFVKELNIRDLPKNIAFSLKEWITCFFANILYLIYGVYHEND